MRTGKVRPVSNDTPGGVSAMSNMNRQKPDQSHNQDINQDKGRPSTPPDFKGMRYVGDIGNIQPLGRK